MTVRFELTPRLAEIAGAREIPVELPRRATLGEALDRLAGEMAHPLTEEGRLHPSILVLFRGEAVRHEEPTPLDDGESIQLLLPVAGG